MLEEIVTPLLQWYDRNARILPWREDPRPYRVGGSVIRLPQTRVEAVILFCEGCLRGLLQRILLLESWQNARMTSSCTSGKGLGIIIGFGTCKRRHWRL